MRVPPLRLLWVSQYTPQQRDAPTAIALVLLSVRLSLQKDGFFITAEPEGELNPSQHGVSVRVVVHSRPLALDRAAPGPACAETQGGKALLLSQTDVVRNSTH